MNKVILKQEHIHICFTDTAMVCKDEYTGTTIVFSGADEFVLYVSENGAIRPYFSSEMEKTFRSDKQGAGTFCFAGNGFEAEVSYKIEDYRIIKRVRIADNAKRKLVRIACENRRCNLALQRGGEGQPVFIGNVMWCGIEFPAANNGQDGQSLNLMQAPFCGLDTPFESFDVVFAFSRGNSLENSFRRYIEQMRPRENLKIYCDWGLHDDLSDNIELTEEMTRNNINKLDILMKKSGVRFDYYLMDAFWFEENQPYICFKERTFPKGIDYIIQMLEEKGIKFGLWFDLNCIHVHLKGMEKYDTLLENGSLCFACDEIADMMFEAIRYHILNHKVQLIKLDFAYFECKNPTHGHSIDFVESKEKSIVNFIRMTQRLKEIDPGLKIICYNGWTTELDWIGSVKQKSGFAVSPYWSRSVNYVYCGDPRPSEIVTPDLADSLVYYTDAMIRNFYDALMPFGGIDDHGTMIGDTATIYRLGKKLFRCGWLMNAMRGGGKLHLYGKVDLLDDSDLEYMREVSDVFDDINAGIYETSCILGDARRAEVYGYSISEGDTGYAVILNPATYARPFSLSLPEWENCSIVVERIIENGEKVNSEEKIFTNYTGEISPNGYRLFRWKRLQRVSREGKLVLDAHSELVLCTNGKDVALRFERNGLPLRSLLGYPKGLIVTDGEKVLQSSVETDIWSGISWLYFRVHGEKELHVCYNGDENIAMAYSLEGYRNEHD